MTLNDRASADLACARELADWCRSVHTTAISAFEGEIEVAHRFGAHVEDGVARFGFWTPELLDNRVPEGDVFLEVLAPREPLDLTLSHQETRFEKVYLPVARYEAYTFAAATGLRAGTRNEIGDFYALVWRDPEGTWHRVLDPLAMSLPFGAFAPAELYDVRAMHSGRGDAAYWEGLRGEAPHKVAPPTNILQIHVPTATAGGTLASLTRQFERLANRVEQGLAYEAADPLFLGYDAVQLLPVEPTTVYEAGHDFWLETDGDASEVTVTQTWPRSVNFTAFPMRLNRICRSRPQSPISLSGQGTSMSSLKARSRPSSPGRSRPKISRMTSSRSNSASWSASFPASIFE